MLMLGLYTASKVAPMYQMGRGGLCRYLVLETGQCSKSCGLHPSL